MTELNACNATPDISVSIVSHSQGGLIELLLEDLANFCNEACLEVILTKNVAESFSFVTSEYPFIIRVLENVSPKGFGENHNSAFKLARGKWFCVLNPDIRLLNNPFSILLSYFSCRDLAVIAPAVVTPGGGGEDNFRYFPNLRLMMGKALCRGNGSYDFSMMADPFKVDWVAGMFMLFRSDDFKAVAGFDEKFFLYYEDVDICVRLWKSGRAVLACPKAQVIHDARRMSHKDLRYMRWHIGSMARYLWKHWWRLPRSNVF